MEQQERWPITYSIVPVLATNLEPIVVDSVRCMDSKPLRIVMVTVLELQR